MRGATVSRGRRDSRSRRSPPSEFEQLLPLIAAYQRFYEVEEVDDERNRAFFRRFLAPSEDGLLLGARGEGGCVGYACLYWHFSSLEACECVLMNDLFVDEAARGRGRRPGADRGQPPQSPASAASPSSSGPPPPTTTPPSASTTRTGAERIEWFSTNCGSE